MDTVSPHDNQDNQEKLRYEALVASIGDGLIITNTQGKIISFNKAAESLLGWTKDDAIDKFLQDVVRMEYHSGQNADQGQLNKLTISEPLYFIRKDGTKFPVAVKMSSYVNGEELLGTITLFRDVTAEHNIDQMKTEFISLTSHQLKTPLASVRWYSELLLSGDAGKLTEQQLQFVDNIHTSIRHMNDLVNALLNISRIESGRLKVAPTDTDLRELVNGVIGEVQTRPDAKTRHLEVNIADNIPQIKIDPLLVRQVYMNLISNAVKYTEQGGRVSVSLELKDDNVVSHISDTGLGIPEDEKSHIFERFHRGKNVEMQEISGNGLGLYLTKTLVELSGGQIWFESEEGKGTNFHFTLPLAGSQAKEGAVTLDS